MRERLRGVTGWVLVALIVFGIPNFVGYAQFWWSVLQWIGAHLAIAVQLLGTTAGKWLFMIAAVVVIWLDQVRITKKLHRPHKYSLRTVKGRTLQLRDEMQRFLDKHGPMPEVKKSVDEKDEDFFARTLGATCKWQDAIMHTYELQFAARVNLAFHECGLLGVKHDGLMLLMGKFQTGQSFKEIIDDLTWLGDNVPTG